MYLEYIFTVFNIVFLSIRNDQMLQAEYIILTGLIVLLTFVVAYFAYQGSAIDSTDPIVYKYRTLRRQGRESDIDPTMFPYKCGICNSYVGSKTKHCGSCNKCVSEFDHHCDWLNNCIGQSNFNNFMMLVLTYAIHTALILAITVLNLVNDTGISNVYLVILITVYIIKLIIITNLLIQNVYFMYLGIGTYDYILEQRENSELKRKLNNKEITKEQYH